MMRPFLSALCAGETIETSSGAYSFLVECFALSEDDLLVPNDTRKDSFERRPMYRHEVDAMLLYLRALGLVGSKMVKYTDIFVITDAGRWFLESAPQTIDPGYMLQEFPELKAWLKPGKLTSREKEGRTRLKGFVELPLSEMRRQYYDCDLRSPSVTNTGDCYSCQGKDKQALTKRLGSIDLVDEMSGLEFERFTAVLFKELGYKSSTTKASGDYGADAILEKDGEKIVVQAKNYTGGVGLSAIQEVYTAKALYAADDAWLVTNSSVTQAARNAANRLDVRIIDRSRLLDLMATALDYVENGNPSSRARAEVDNLKDIIDFQYAEHAFLRHQISSILNMFAISNEDFEHLRSAAVKLEEGQHRWYDAQRAFARIGGRKEGRSARVEECNRLVAMAKSASDVDTLKSIVDDIETRCSNGVKWIEIASGTGDEEEIFIPDEYVGFEEEGPKYMLRIIYRGVGAFEVEESNHFFPESGDTLQYEGLAGVSHGPYYSDMRHAFAPTVYVKVPHRDYLDIGWTHLKIKADGYWCIQILPLQPMYGVTISSEVDTPEMLFQHAERYSHKRYCSASINNPITLTEYAANALASRANDQAIKDSTTSKNHGGTIRSKVTPPKVPKPPSFVKAPGAKAPSINKDSAIGSDRDSVVRNNNTPPKVPKPPSFNSRE